MLFAALKQRWPILTTVVAGLLWLANNYNIRGLDGLRLEPKSRGTAVLIRLPVHHLVFQLVSPVVRVCPPVRLRRCGRVLKRALATVRAPSQRAHVAFDQRARGRLSGWLSRTELATHPWTGSVSSPAQWAKRRADARQL